jgi:hypothetical protein
MEETKINKVGRRFIVTLSYNDSPDKLWVELSVETFKGEHEASVICENVKKRISQEKLESATTAMIKDDFSEAAEIIKIIKEENLKINQDENRVLSKSDVKK